MSCMRWLNNLEGKIRGVLPPNLTIRVMTCLRLLEAVQRRPRGYWNFMLNAISQILGLRKPLGDPVSITIEPTNLCNLRCPVCETGANILERKPQMMTYREFVKIIDKVGPGANHVMLYYMGEPFLNKEIYAMIRYTRDMGLFTLTCTNGDLVDPQALYESGINLVSFQIGGVKQETHSRYRVNSNLSKVLDNVSKYLEIIRFRGRKPSENQVELGFIVMRHNEGEIQDFLRLANEIGVDRKNVISPCVRTPEQAVDLLPVSDQFWIYERDCFEKEGSLVPKRRVPSNSCPWLYYSITIQVDGSVVPCCRDPHGRYVVGNLLEESLDAVWKGSRFRAFRRDVATGQAGVSICHLCPGEGLPGLYTI
jgi:radical SAM protein with 4Fe4S-binding SPASM domain